MRSTGWLLLYAAVVTAPLAVATLTSDGRAGFGAALGGSVGWAAFGLLVAQFALVTRVRSATAAFGSDALLLFHRLMSFAALAFLALHVWLLVPGLPSLLSPSPASRYGAIAGAAAAVLVVTSVWRRRLRWSYELWLATHRVLAIALVSTMAWHVHLALAPHPAARAIGWTYAAAALAALGFQRFVRPLWRSRRPWEVVENRDEGASTRTLVLRAVGHPGLAFAPGQFVWLATGRRGLFAEEHPITIASSPERDGGRTLELAIKALGDWSGAVVPALRPGARVRIDGPFGAFTYEVAAAQRLVLVAGGVGVTPMRSMLLAMRDRGDRRPVVLLFAAHDRSRAMFVAELEGLQAELDLRMVLVLEAPGPDERCERGLVTADVLRRHLPADLRFTHFFVCGPPPMVAALERITAQLGVPTRHVHTERFDMI